MLNKDLDMFSLFFNNNDFNGLENRPMRYEVITSNEGAILVYSANGISKDDVKIDFETKLGRQNLKLSGKTEDKITGKIFSINASFDVRVVIKDIEWKMENGLIYIFLKEEKNSSSIKISYKK